MAPMSEENAARVRRFVAPLRGGRFVADFTTHRERFLQLLRDCDIRLDGQWWPASKMVLIKQILSICSLPVALANPEIFTVESGFVNNAVGFPSRDCRDVSTGGDHVFVIQNARDLCMLVFHASPLTCPPKAGGCCRACQNGEGPFDRCLQVQVRDSWDDELHFGGACTCCAARKSTCSLEQ